MQLTEQGILHIEEEDISSLYCYRDTDGKAFDASFLFELQLQGLTLPPGSVRGIQFDFEEEESPLYEDRERLVAEVRCSQRFVPLMRSMMAQL
ncbi:MULTISPECIES: hypothetical protein [unclassified Paenibacillus]|uniref:hypothetical protein n=1 Tax=unclassified Paenibacillus TaxID=185978 RepID=UPI000CFA8461|nr:MULTISPECIES: hypothetical protein [unclassified Paenibacillus]PQZ99868.1 hypothetical protein CQ043_27590 [Paenibacillus sp. MYb63]PRA44132.1 hypothetical protein CQ061_26270 [Paenibacillus sp. MYb67]QZN76371.1 hypothetical protein K5K90_03530 [Paenibacillus sp. DR312]